MLRIGICDDESGARDALRFSIEHLLREEEGKVFYDFSSGEGVIQWLIKHSGELDTLFLDVELGGISGMETARQIREHDTNLMLVFVTGYSDFVFDGYTVGAMDYLVKPVKEGKLRLVLDRAQKLMESRRRSPCKTRKACTALQKRTFFTCSVKSGWSRFGPK